MTGHPDDDAGVVAWDFGGTLGHRRNGTWAECPLEIGNRQQPDRAFTHAGVYDALATGFPWHHHDRPHPHLADPDTWWAHVTGIVAQALRGLGMPREAAAAAAHATRAACTDPACTPDRGGTGSTHRPRLAATWCAPTTSPNSR
ncbi:hypothetical protein [Streptomyces radicis]|uniref:hypothetical protein n=1 Tax=Streptomyces radicis TaxID=1750517 RepID=UPI001E32DF90|nr:hypothetical protein [Streptomyces radicis]